MTNHSFLVRDALHELIDHMVSDEYITSQMSRGSPEYVHTLIAHQIQGVLCVVDILLGKELLPKNEYDALLEQLTDALIKLYNHFNPIPVE